MEAKEDTDVVLFFFFLSHLSGLVDSKRHARVKMPPLDEVTREGLPGKVTFQ